ncbi:MAG: DsbA family protein [Thermomicrobiales bacterium]|nr:DsbA family protein [Thermomicrobiales bacterium]MCO5218513.1 DsbA family protein [Thermomicrobiales bacterium]MCO5224801.1 DsbA family protein [Thermomicrobiales bacterium]MCO5227613.1 DsbA family protein [Thermomicrobiales bacterium]
MSRQPQKKKSNAKQPARNASQKQPQANTQPSQPKATSAETAAKRNARKEAAEAQAKKKKQLQMIIGGVVIALVVVVIAIFINRPSADGIQIDYSGIAQAPSTVIATQGTPAPTLDPANPLGFATGFSVGDVDAPVTMHIFTDFQCHYCLDWHNNQLPHLVEDFVRTGQVRLVFHDYPFLGSDSSIADPNDLTIELRDPNNESSQAAQAAMCAGEQDKFFEYGDKLWGNYGGIQQGYFKRANLNRFASDLGLNMDQFNECMDTQRYVPALAESRQQAAAQGISSTPMFILDNGSGDLNVVTNSGDYNILKKTVEASIKTAQ